MSIAALFERLTDFAPHAAREDNDKPFPEQTYPQAVPQPDLPTLIAIAVTEAEEALTARLVAEHEAALETERQQHAAELSAFGIHMGTETGAAMAAGLRDMEARVVHLATDAAARIIAGLVSDDIRTRSIDALAAAVLSAMEDREAVRIRVSGPQFMFDALATALGERSGNVDFTEATGFDLSVSIDDNLFETRLGEWSSALSETVP